MITLRDFQSDIMKRFTRNLEHAVAMADARIAISRSGAFSVPRQVVALNEAVKAGVVFG